MKIKTSELTGDALDWAVAKAEGRAVARHTTGTIYLIERPWRDQSRVRWLGLWSPSIAWAQGGAIIERERIAVVYEPEWEVPNWGAWRTDIDDRQEIMGETALIAAMRCWVASQLGAEVDVPEELLP